MGVPSAVAITAKNAIFRPITAAAAAALDLALPRRCLACGVTLAAGPPAAGLCDACWRQVRFLAAPQCARCGDPFDQPAPAGAECGACLAAPPPYDRARAVMAYGPVSGAMVQGFKHGDRTHAAPTFGAWLARAGADMVAAADLVVPVPLHRRRLHRRRYNQAAMLAAALCRHVDRHGGAAPAMAANGLIRVRATPSQKGRGPAARAANVRGAFAVAADVAGRQVLLVDDVFTTGATAGECARRLRRAGAAGVTVLTLAKVIHDETHTEVNGMLT